MQHFSNLTIRELGARIAPYVRIILVFLPALVYVFLSAGAGVAFLLFAGILAGAMLRASQLARPSAVSGVAGMEGGR